MKTILLIASTLFLLFAGYQTKVPAKVDVANTSLQDSVLICDSPNAYAYHIKWCSGLQKCTHDVYKVTIQDAIDEGKGKPCGFCY